MKIVFVPNRKRARARSLSAVGFDPSVPPYVSCPIFSIGSSCEIAQTEDRLRWKYDELRQYALSSGATGEELCAYSAQIATNLKNAIETYFSNCTVAFAQGCVPRYRFDWASFNNLIYTYHKQFIDGLGFQCAHYSAIPEEISGNCAEGQVPLFGGCYNITTLAFWGIGGLVAITILPSILGIFSGRR